MAFELAPYDPPAVYGEEVVEAPSSSFPSTSLCLYIYKTANLWPRTER